METAAAISERLDVGWSTVSNLHEHRRGVMQWRGAAEWKRLLERFFETPDELVFGDETATDALRRFSTAVGSLANQVEDKASPLAIVSHGTAMSLYVAQRLDVDPFTFWRQLKLPDYVELDVDIQMEMP